MDEIVNSRSPSVKPEILSDIFIRLMWLCDLQIVSVFESWLIECKDSYKVEIVLRNPEVFPFVEYKEFNRVISIIKFKMPEHIDLCEKMINDRQSQSQASF